MLPLFFLAVMKPSSNRREQREVFRNAMFGHQVAGSGFMAGKQLHAELLRNGIPSGRPAPCLDGAVGQTEKTLDLMHGAGFVNDLVEKKAAAVRREASVADAADRKEQCGTEGVREKQAQGTGSQMVADVADAVQVFGDMPFNGVESPAHAGHQVFCPALARQHGCEAARFQKAKGGKSHAAVADMVGQTAENVRHLRKTRIEKIQ